MLWELSDKSAFNVFVVLITVAIALAMTGGVISRTYGHLNYMTTYEGQVHVAITMLLWISLAIGVGKKAFQIDNECDGDCDNCGGKLKEQERYIV